MMHPERVEVYDQKGGSIGIVARTRFSPLYQCFFLFGHLSVSFVKESTGQTCERSLKQWKQGDSFSRKRNCAPQDTGENTVATVVVINARPSTTPLSVTDLEERRRKLHKVLTQC